MNYQQFDRAMALKGPEIRRFFLLLVGLNCFLKGEKVSRLSRESFFEEFRPEDQNDKAIKQSYSLRLKIFDGELTSYVLFRNKDKRFCRFLTPTDLEFLPLVKYPDSLNPDIVDLLIDASRDNFLYDFEYGKIEALLELRRLKNYDYRFVVGSGINSGYGFPLWKDLEKEFKGATDCILGKKGACEEISQNTFNSNYGFFQITKDISVTEYQKIIEDVINSAIEPSPSDDTTLTAVAAVLYAQSLRRAKNGQKVLTFNYDDWLERALKKCYQADVVTFFKTMPIQPPNHYSSFQVIHSHGFIPKFPNPVFAYHYRSLVLTTDEYFANYKSPSSYGYKQLYDHLNDTCCFVGNSLTDYEEQKVISNHFEDHPSQFHYFYGSTEGLSDEVILYKTLFLLRMGVIPLWYPSHAAYKAEFRKYAKSLMK